MAKIIEIDPRDSIIANKQNVIELYSAKKESMSLALKIFIIIISVLIFAFSAYFTSINTFWIFAPTKPPISVRIAQFDGGDPTPGVHVLYSRDDVPNVKDRIKLAIGDIGKLQYGYVIAGQYAHIEKCGETKNTYCVTSVRKKQYKIQIPTNHKTEIPTQTKSRAIILNNGKIEEIYLDNILGKATKIGEKN